MIIIERNEANFKRYGSTMDQNDLMYLLNQKVEPHSNRVYGDEYCASVTLNDGMFLSCVVFRHIGKGVELTYEALHKKHYGIKDKRPYDQEFVQKGIIEHELTSENKITFDSCMIKAEKCIYAMPDRILERLITGPTHYFLARFKDGSYENFRRGEGQFYEVPLNKKLEDIVEIFNSTLILQNNEIMELKTLMDWKNNEEILKKIHIGKTYFVYYIGHSDYKDFAEHIAHIKNRWE